ncbi:FAD/NAD(P)-binding protein [Streptomyces sp. NPDC001262]|uniref:FAD/NAD(P)-binding protein n=1 Tax=Streptomyces sp. NPDC001262 TaxID=3364552 RepID=UPI003686B205
MAHTVIIVGAGVAGTSVLVHLVDALTRTGRTGLPCSVHLVDPHPPGWGLAFGDDDPLLLCNSAAEINSVRADRLDDFVVHLRAHGWTGTPKDCVPRARMAEYCHERSAQATALAAAHGIDVHHHRTTAESVGTGTGHPVRLGTGEDLAGDAVIISTGVQRPRVPRAFEDFTEHPAYLDSPYPAHRLREALHPGGRVLVPGTRQSAIDASLLLCREGHRVTLTSPSGQLPAVRPSLAAPGRPLPPLDRIAALDPADPHLADRVMRCAVEALRLLGPRPLRLQTSAAADPVQRLREETALVEAGACAWPDLVVPVIEAAIALGGRLPEHRRRALLAHFAPFTGRYATAMTVVNAHRLLARFDAGALRIAPAYPAAVAFHDGAWQVRWPDGRPERFEHVVNATGFELPALHWDQDRSALHLSGPQPGGGVLGRLEADLRVRRHPQAQPERVWLAGVGTHVRIPFSNHLRNVARQARHVAGQVAEQVAAGAPAR